MGLVKGIERCRYISGVIDSIDNMVWVKDIHDNLIFANESAFKFFKKISKDDTVECPMDIKIYESYKTVNIDVDGEEMWLKLSSMPVLKDDGSFDCMLVIAVNITKKRKDEMRVSNILDEKISQWKEEKRKRMEKISKSNEEIFNMLNLVKERKMEVTAI